MIKGMTGYGQIQFSAGGTKGIIEIKSQNHRYFDVAYFLPVGFASIENRIHEILQGAISRGRVTVSLKITEKPSLEVHFNKETIRAYLKHANALKKEFSLNNSLTLADVIKLPGVIETKEVLLDVEKLWPVIDKNLKKALSGLLQMRDREGKSLSVDIAQILKRMQLQVKKIEARTKSLLAEKKKSLTPEEFSSYQRSCDINEEITRLRHYIEEFGLLLKAQVVVGKKMDFVGQEMQRETNTIGSKVQDGIVSNAVIALKSKVEKLREQAQNIE
jgi:uncharacterized protein (TIGR00255 family)